MALRGYSSVSDVSAYLGRTLTVAQQTFADRVLGVAETYIDRLSNRSWITGTQTNELHPLASSITLLRTPVTSVTTVQRRTQAIGDTWTTLTAGVDYELFDPLTGTLNIYQGWGTNLTTFARTLDSHLYLSWNSHLSYVQVTYVPANPVPNDISFAATLIAAQTIRSAIFPDRVGISKVQIDEATSVTYTDGDITLVIPPTADQIIRGYRIPVFA